MDSDPRARDDPHHLQAEIFSARAVVLVEGVSDQLALEALAERRGRNLVAEGISIVPISGSKNINSFLGRSGPQGLDVKLAGLCDANEQATSSVAWNERAWVPTSLATKWNHSASTCASQTWRTS